MEETQGSGEVVPVSHTISAQVQGGEVPVDIAVPASYTDVLQQHKRGREEEVIQPQYDEVGGVMKKSKLGESEDGLVLVNPLAMPSYAATGNIKNPIFEGVPSLTPEWLLKRVWLKVNGELNATVWAGVISKDMGSNLRKEIRTYLENENKVPPTGRINLKTTIMHAFDYTSSCQDTPMFTIIRDSARDINKPKKEGKKEKDFMISLTPYGQSVCMNELKLRKRDRFTQRSGSDLHKDPQLLPSLGSVVPTPAAPSPIPTAQLDLSNVREIENELERRDMQIRDQSTKVEYLAQQLEKKEYENAQLRAWMEQYKPLISGYQPTHDTLIAADVLSQNQSQIAQQLYQNSTAAGVTAVNHQM